MSIEGAIFNDCNNIINNFIHSGNLRFESFCVQWKKMMFQHMYSAQSSNNEVLQTTTAALHITKRILCHSSGENNAHRGIGALYLMYAIYFKQPTDRYIKIDVSLQSWKKIRNFISAVEGSPEADEARYIFWKLYKANAFRFCALDYHVGLENLVDYDTIEEEKTVELNRTSAKLMRELQELTTAKNMIPALTTLEAGYNKMKASLAKEKNLDQQSLPPTTIFKDLQQVFGNIQDIIGKKNETDVKSDDTPRDKRDLKSKAYKVTHSKESSKNDSTSKGPYKRAHRMSAKTIFSEELPDELLADLEKNSSEENDTNADVEESSSFSLDVI